MNLAALKSLALPKLLTPQHRQTMQQRRTVAATIQHNQQAAQRRHKNRLRKQAADTYRHQAAIDTAHHLGIPANRLGLYLLSTFTPIILKTHRIIWLELRSLYNLKALTQKSR